MMNTPFHSSRSSIENARRHLAKFQAQERVFFDSNPYANVIEHNADGTEDFHKIKLTKHIPDILSNIAFDLVNNLRAALDHAGFNVAVASGTKGKNANFPFGGDLADTKLKHTQRSKDIPKALFDLMISFKPYKGGDNLLWALNKLCNTNKHEILTAMAMATGGGNIDRAIINQVLSFKFPPRWDRAKNELVILHTPRGTQFDINIQIQTFITLANIEITQAIGEHPANIIFNDLVGKVDSIISAIETEARRLKLIS